MRTPAVHIYSFLCISVLAMIAGCSLQKDTAAKKGMQNLTARYNILYNARLLLEESQRTINDAYRDDYVSLLPVYKEPNETLVQSEGKRLDEVIQKSNKIISEKSASNYTDEAYLLIGEANYLKASFFNAVEFFNYVINTYPKEKELKQAAMVQKARALMQLERYEEAEIVLDTALRNIADDKRSVSDLYATRAQLHLYASENTEAASLLQKAVDEARNKDLKIRWQYILGQLSLMLGKNEDAHRYFTEVTRSNAPFEMAFNAELNRMGIEEGQGGQALTRTERLAKLLKDDKNRDLKDQIWYQIGESYLKENNTAEAVASYNNSIRSSTTNITQKGLTYLKLAEVYFQSGQYVKSKLYYDSTLATLPKTFPDFNLIAKKADNLVLISSRLQVIANEDSLQLIARLPETEREARIGQLVRDQARRAIDQNVSEAPNNPVILADNNQGSTATTDGKFYFNNLTAIGQGYSDFRRRWGTRRLGDDWRRSQKSSAEIANAPAASDSGGPATSAPMVTVDENAMAENIRKSLPLTPDQLTASNKRIASAYFDIGNYYRDILNDEAQAIKAFEELNTRFPDSENKLAVYYNLYRLYALNNPVKSEEYRRLLVEKYPESPYAKVITDPNFYQRNNEKELAVANAFGAAYTDYTLKKYPEVLATIANTQANYGTTSYSAQLDYLKALAIGRTQNLAPFEAELKAIAAAYPTDNLTTPLVKQHLDYVEANRAKLAARQYVIVDFDPNEPRYVEPAADSPNAPVVAQQPVNQPINPVTGAPVTTPTIQGTTPAPVNTQPAAKPASLFSMPDTGTYYFIINVPDPGVNLSSSRFGIGQFNRLNFPDGNIKHQLKLVNQENQLIFVGEFHSRKTVSDYADNILPLMPQIMKIPTGRYNMFIITAQDLEKLTNRDMINQYLEFFNTNYAN